MNLCSMSATTSSHQICNTSYLSEILYTFINNELSNLFLFRDSLRVCCSSAAKSITGYIIAKVDTSGIDAADALSTKSGAAACQYRLLKSIAIVEDELGRRAQPRHGKLSLITLSASVWSSASRYATSNLVKVE